MAFEIKPIDPKLFAEFYTPAVARELDQFIYASRIWTKDLSGKRWAIDEQRGACFLWVHMADRMNSDRSYALVWQGWVVLISQKAYCQYVIVYASEKVHSRMDEVEEMMREALRLGGEFLDGTTDPTSTRAVPCAEFHSKKSGMNNV